MLKATANLVLPTAMVGSYPRPLWFNESLHGRDFKQAMGDSIFREQYMDAVACIINAQESAGLDILTDGDSRFDLAVGGKHWFFYVLERLGGTAGNRDTSAAWSSFGFRPGHILWEVMEAYRPVTITKPVSRGPLEYAAIWKVAQRLTSKPVKFGTISAPMLPQMIINDFYQHDRPLVEDLASIINAELKELAAAGCQVIQVEEPTHHSASLDSRITDEDLADMTALFNKQLNGVNAEIWVHTCWGNPNQQSRFWDPPSYAKAIPHLLQLDADVITFECASTNGKDLPLFAKYKTDKKIGIGVISHTRTNVESPEQVANLIRKALEYIPPERLVITTDCGFGREGLSRRIAQYKLVSLVLGTNLVRRELQLPEAPVRIADPKLWSFPLTESTSTAAH